MAKKKKTAKKPVKKKAVKKPVKKALKAMPKAPQRITAEQKVWGLLAYIFILFILPLAFRKDDDFAHFHAKQGLVFFITAFAAAIFLLIPIVGWIVGSLIIVALAAFWALAVIHVLFGKTWSMPLIGKWAKDMRI
ncbi:MAG: hypothetical protein ABIB71_06325 [Candidatus Woesearchaeota archaeon]